MRPSRGVDPLTPAQIADWEARAYPALTRHRDIAASTPVDDELPENPEAHLDETCAALEHIPLA